MGLLVWFTHSTAVKCVKNAFFFNATYRYVKQERMKHFSREKLLGPKFSKSPSKCEHCETRFTSYEVTSERRDFNWCWFSASSPRYVIWCCGGICQEDFPFIQNGSGHTRPVNLHPLFLFWKHVSVCDPEKK